MATAESRINHHFAFRVADVQVTRKELEARGVKIIMSNARPDGMMQIFVVDPVGYIIEFSDNIRGQPSAL